LEEGPNAFNGFIEKTITLPQKGSSILPNLKAIATEASQGISWKPANVLTTRPDWSPYWWPGKPRICVV